MTDSADMTGASVPQPEMSSGQVSPPGATGSGSAGRAATPPIAPEPPASGAEQPQPEPEPKRESLIDAVADLLQMIVNYLRQEAGALMRDKVVLPGQRLGSMIAFAFAAAFALALGIGFVAVALLLLLARWLTWPGALGLIGGLLIVGAAYFTWLKVRSIQT